MTGTRLMGTSAFLRRAGISAPLMRGLEAAGVIAPARTFDTGWRMFTETDVAAVERWKEAQSASRKKSHRKG